jgi:hypothetical protein
MCRTSGAPARPIVTDFSALGSSQHVRSGCRPTVLPRGIRGAGHHRRKPPMRPAQSSRCPGSQHRRRREAGGSPNRPFMSTGQQRPPPSPPDRENDRRNHRELTGQAGVSRLRSTLRRPPPGTGKSLLKLSETWTLPAGRSIRASRPTQPASSIGDRASLGSARYGGKRKAGGRDRLDPAFRHNRCWPTGPLRFFRRRPSRSGPTLQLTHSIAAIFSPDSGDIGGAACFAMEARRCTERLGLSIRIWRRSHAPHESPHE